LSEISFSKKELQALKKNLLLLRGGQNMVDEIARFGAESIIAEAILKVPVDMGELQQSTDIQRLSKGVYRFGFFKSYAKVMDQGFNKKIIKPVKAKALFIPITRRGKRSGPARGGIRRLGASRASGGAIAGKDFIFRKSMKAPRMKAYGSRRGPNRYFSGTVKKMTSNKIKFLEKLARAFKQQLKIQGD